MSLIRPSHMLVLATLLIALAIVACGGAKKTTSQPGVTPTTVAGAGIQPIIASSDLTIGSNRFLLGLADQEKMSLVIDAQLHLRFFKLDEAGRPQALKAEMGARPLTVQKNYTHVHQDGQIETHEAGTVGVYLANVEFDSPGAWGVVITGMQKEGQPLPTLTPSFEVQEKSSTVAIGQPAPRTVQHILSDVKDIFDIDTSNPPDPHMHSMTIADAVTSGNPTVMVFSTPGFCQTQLCGPTKDMVDQLYQKYQGQANFIHVEPYDLEKARSGQKLEAVPATTDWGLQSEPWVFMVDQEGKVAAKFEGIVGFDELEGAFTALLAPSKG